jgi:hypothetical protein
MKVDFGAGVLEVEAPEKFVESHLDRIERLISSIGRPAVSPHPPEQALNSAAEVGDGSLKGKKRAKPPRNGPSCPDRILSLKTDSFFSSPKTIDDVGIALRERATPYAKKNISAALFNMTQRGDLRRVTAGDQFEYVNP